MRTPFTRGGGISRRLALFGGAAASLRAAAPPANGCLSASSLESLHDQLRAVGHDAQARPTRLRLMNLIQTAADVLEPAQYRAWISGQTPLESAPEILRYLRLCSDRAIAEFRATRVRDGAVLWLIYNMGYLVRTPRAGFGFDLHLRDAAALAGDLDFLLISHEHGDHSSPDLLKAMLQSGKPVVTRWFPGSRIISAPSEFELSGIRVKIDIGDHHRTSPDGQNNMLMHQVEIRGRDRSWVLYHSGDGNNYLKMTPDRPVDVFIPHIEVGMNVPEAIGHLKPRVTLPSHVLELAHSRQPPQAYRWSWEAAYHNVRSVPVDQIAMPTWGERYVLQGTELASS